MRPAAMPQTNANISRGMSGCLWRIADNWMLQFDICSNSAITSGSSKSTPLPPPRLWDQIAQGFTVLEIVIGFELLAAAWIGPQLLNGLLAGLDARRRWREECAPSAHQLAVDGSQ